MTLLCVVMSIRNPAHSPVYSVNSPSKRSLDFLQTYLTPIILHVPRNVLSTKTHATWAIHQSDRNQFENKHGVCTLISTIIYVNGCVVLLNILITSITVKIFIRFVQIMRVIVKFCRTVVISFNLQLFGKLFVFYRSWNCFENFTDCVSRSRCYFVNKNVGYLMN